jgi:hypothetical protein
MLLPTIPGYEFEGDWDSWTQPFSFLLIITFLTLLLLAIIVRRVSRMTFWPLKALICCVLMLATTIVFVTLFVGHTYVVMKQLYSPQLVQAWGLGAISPNSVKIWVKSINSTKFFVQYSTPGAVGMALIAFSIDFNFQRKSVTLFRC